MAAWVYILECKGGKFYVGISRGDLARRIDAHNAGKYDGSTKSRRPVVLVYSQQFTRTTDAIAAERQLKGWSLAKKRALIDGDITALVKLSKSRQSCTPPSTGSG